MTARRCAALAAGIGLLTPAAAGGAAEPIRLVELPGVGALPQVPPLAPPQPPLLETPRLRGSVTSDERVVVGIDGRGTPTGVTVVQRLEVNSLGDFAFYIPAPAVRVVAAEGSESQPGLRPNQIVWQGFSPRRKLLAARAVLRPRASVAALPLRVRVAGAPAASGPFRLTVLVENATSARVAALSGNAFAKDATAAFDALAAAAESKRLAPARVVRVRGTTVPATVAVSAPFAVEGTVRFPARAVPKAAPARFSGVVGRGALRFSVRGVALRPASPRIRLVAEPVLEAPARPPAAAGRKLLRRTIAAYLRYARARQYLTFLANPDLTGPSEATYVYETAARRRAAAPAAGPGSGGLDVPLFVFVAAGVLGAAGLVVLWAHL